MKTRVEKVNLSSSVLVLLEAWRKNKVIYQFLKSVLELNRKKSNPNREGDETRREQIL